MKTTYRITGHEALRLAERDSLTTYCYANPLDDGGPVNHGVARQIIKDDPSLIYIDVVQHDPNGWITKEGPMVEMPGYNISDYFNASNGEYLGPDDEGVEPRWDDAPALDLDALAAEEFEIMSDEARSDAAAGNWDEVMADRANARLPRSLSDDEFRSAARDLQSRISELARK